MTEKTITLSTPITVHGGVTTQVVVREPKGKDYIELGHPTTLVRTKNGVAEVQNDDVIAAYINRCVDVDPLLLVQQASLKDAMAIKDAVLDFFIGAQTKQSDSSANISSSGSASSPPTE
jgi:hypothetical protein